MLSQNVQRGAIISIGFLFFDDRVFNQSSSYTYNDLLANSHYMKFDVKEQVEKYNRIVDKSTLQFWKEQPKEVQEMVGPLPNDLPLTRLVETFDNIDWTSIKRVYTRGNTFDPIILDHVYQSFGLKDQFPFDWWKVRDTRSLIEGMSWGTDIRNDFIPPEPEGLESKINLHNPVDDIILDVLRMQYMVQLIT